MDGRELIQLHLLHSVEPFTCGLWTTSRESDQDIVCDIVCPHLLGSVPSSVVNRLYGSKRVSAGKYYGQFKHIFACLCV